MNEFPYYLICQKCTNSPTIVLKDNENILLSCSKCNIQENEKIKNIVNYTSKWVSNTIKYCQEEHEEKKPSRMYCKIHNLFLCQDCFEQHQLLHDIISSPNYKGNLINVEFRTSQGINLDFNFSEEMSINEAFKIFMKRFDLSKSEMKNIVFLHNSKKIDSESEKTLKEIGIKNYSIIKVIDQNNFLSEFFEVQKMQKNKCIIHDDKLTSFCTQCNMEICEKCINKHNNHSFENLGNKNEHIKNYLEEFETFIINSENNKRDILKKVIENIDSFENYKIENNDLNEEINIVINKIKEKFYKYLIIGQNLFDLSKILLFSFIRMDKNDEKIKIYKEVINSIKQYFNEEIIKEFDFNNFKIIYEYKDKIKSIYKRSYDFIPKVNLLFKEVQKIDKEILDSLITKIKELFNGKNIKIIEIKKGSLSVTLALNYLIQEKIKNINEENKILNKFFEELNEYLKVETENIKNILKDKLCIAQKDKIYKPDFAQENLFDLESDNSKEELKKYIKENKCKNDNSRNIYEISKEITFEDMKNFFESLSDETKEIQDLLYERFSEANNELENYLQIFDSQFEEALKKSVFEYATKYIAYIYKNDEKFNSGQLHCNNIQRKLLFHGTNSFCISRILGSQFRNSEIHIFGQGIYFSDSLDYTWYYSDDSERFGTRKNFGIIPEIGDSFSFIAVNTYYDKDKFEQIYESNKKIRDEIVQDFGIRHILVDSRSAAIPKNKLGDYKQFIGTEYLISNKSQILPLLSITMERVKYLIVWRDNNFDPSNPNDYSQFDKMIEFNNEIKNFAAINLKTKIYYFNETDEALKFIRKKIYNKIILITNGGNKGDDFIKKARKIIGNDTIALVTCFVAKDHLKMVQDMENVLLSSPDFNCMKKFLSLVCEENLEEIKNLQKESEVKYKKLDKSFCFKKIDESAFKFPKFKESGEFKELDFGDKDDNCLII